MWVGTPTASMWIRSEKFKDGREPNPAEFIQMWPTPRANKPEGYSSENFRPTLAQVVTGEEKPQHGQLNPTWVEWLMGFPPGWTDLNV
jgi:hypothetical protein